MRNPFRSEADAFRFVWLTIGYFALIVIGSLINVWVGVAVFVVLTAVALWWLFAAASGKRPVKQTPAASPPGRVPDPRRRERDGRRPGAAARDPRAVGGTRRHACSSSARRSTRRSATGSPTRTTRAPPRRRASTRASRRCAPPALDATGEIGDGDPIQAIEDAVRTFRPDELIISTHPAGRSHWLERGRRREGARAFRRARSRTSSSTSTQTRPDDRRRRSAAARGRAPRGAPVGARRRRALGRLGARAPAGAHDRATTSSSSSRARAMRSRASATATRAAYGQWWTDRVARSLTAAQRAEWLDPPHFEIVELHVRPAPQRRGVGSALLAQLLTRQPHDRALLSTQTGSRKARGFYAKNGWSELASVDFGAGLPAVPRARQAPELARYLPATLERRTSRRP